VPKIVTLVTVFCGGHQGLTSPHPLCQEGVFDQTHPPDKGAVKSAFAEPPEETVTRVTILPYGRGWGEPLARQRLQRWAQGGGVGEGKGWGRGDEGSLDPSKLLAFASDSAPFLHASLVVWGEEGVTTATAAPSI
jgi:hypothetical protein